jgi:Rad3-related DNA helicase
VFSYGRARDREQALDDFLSHPRGIMVAPSFERGVDLQGDDCRVVIIVKIPYPTLADKQISARLRLPGGNGWYSMNTVRTLVQMTGRAMRSEEDHCEIYLLDRQFMQNVWRKSRQLLPAWWREALVMGGSDVPR